MRDLTGDLSQRCGACAVTLLRVHLPGVGAAPPRSSHGAPVPQQCVDRAEQHQQWVPGRRYPGGIHLHLRRQQTKRMWLNKSKLRVQLLYN